MTNRYTYDKLNRLVREDNKPIGQTTVFSYDTNGNILTKTAYAFTLGTLLEKSPISLTPYSYRATIWRDQMTAFNGEKCEYDAMGYPIKYRNHITQFMFGGRMMAFDSNSYVYDAEGERISKTVNGVETKFITASGKIVRSISNGTVTDFFYDNYGLSGIRHQGVSYFVRKNVLGDVTHIYDTSGNLQGQYVYDAWGNHKVLKADGTEDIDTMSIGNINPIRYRSCYFDTETKLYYLKTRYYDPEVGRFISTDDTQFLAPNTVNGLNLYAYCGSNPVMSVDPSGTKFGDNFLYVVGLIATAVVGVAAIAGGIFASIATFGAATPAVALGLSVLGGAAMGLGSALISNMASQIQTNGLGNVDLIRTWTAGCIGGAIGALSGAISYGFGEVAASFGETFGYMLSNTRIGGRLVSKVFSPLVLKTVFTGIGKAVGITAGAFLGDYLGNSIFYSSYTKDDTQGTANSVLIDLLLEFGHWLYNL